MLTQAPLSIWNGSHTQNNKAGEVFVEKKGFHGWGGDDKKDNNDDYYQSTLYIQMELYRAWITEKNNFNVAIHIWDVNLPKVPQTVTVLSEAQGPSPRAAPWVLLLWVDLLWSLRAEGVGPREVPSLESPRSLCGRYSGTVEMVWWVKELQHMPKNLGLIPETMSRTRCGSKHL